MYCDRLLYSKDPGRVPQNNVRQYRRDDLQYPLGQAEPDRSGRDRDGAGKAGVF